MASIAYALSVQHFVNSVGAKAGFASIIGLALLVLLFFTQSRETANLRRRADEAEQQLQQLQLYVDHLSRQRSAPAAAPASAQSTGAPVAAPPAAAAARLARAGASRAVPGDQAAGAVATIPAAPAGVGAPALSSATRLIPLAQAEEISIRALKPSTNGDGEHASDATVATPPPAPAPSTAAGGSGGNGGNGGNGVAHPPVPVPMPTMAGPAATPAPAPAPRVAPPRQPRPPVSPPPRRRGRREPSGRRPSSVFFVVAGVLAVAVIAVALAFVLGSSGNNTPPQASSSSGSASSTAAARTGKGAKHRRTVAAAPVTPGSVTVAVLNGTATNNLAHNVLAKLTAAGYRGTTTQNAAESGVTSTIVGYTSQSAQPDAAAVAKSLNLGAASVQGISQGDRGKVCGTTATCPDQVVVTVGSDLAQSG